MKAGGLLGWGLLRCYGAEGAGINAAGAPPKINGPVIECLGWPGTSADLIAIGMTTEVSPAPKPLEKVNTDEARFDPGAYMEKNCGTFSQEPWPDGICYFYPGVTSLMVEQKKDYPQDFEKVSSEVAQDPGQGPADEVDDRKGPGWEATGAVMSEGAAGAVMSLDIEQGFHQDTNGDSVIHRFFDHGLFNASAAKMEESSLAVTKEYQRRQQMLADDLQEMVTKLRAEKLTAAAAKLKLYDQSIDALEIYRKIAQGRAEMLGIAVCQLKVMDAVNLARQRLMLSASVVDTASLIATDTRVSTDTQTASDITGFEDPTQRVLSSRSTNDRVATATFVATSTRTEEATIQLGNEPIEPERGVHFSPVRLPAGDLSLFVRVHRKIESKQLRGDVYFDRSDEPPEDFRRLLP